jgi:sec-independent protein translocase protein TatA
MMAWIPGPWELVIIGGIVAVLIFGRRLPDLGRSLGQGLVEFKKGLKGVKDEVDAAGDEVAKAGNEPEGKDA